MKSYNQQNTFKFLSVRHTLSGFLLLAASVVMADDTSIYFNADVGVKPNILFLIDSSGSMDWSLHESPENYDSSKIYEGKPVASGTVFESDKLYYSPNNKDFTQIPHAINTCQALKEEEGFLQDRFIGLLAYDEPEARPGEGWKRLDHEKEYSYQVTTTSPGEPNCGWHNTDAARQLGVRGTHIVNLDRVRVKHHNEYYWDNKRGKKRYTGKRKSKFVIYENGDTLYQANNSRNSTSEYVCIPTTITNTETKIAEGEWRALECRVDRNKTGKSASHTELNYPKASGGPDIAKTSTEPASSATDIDGWWRAAATNLSYSSGVLAYGNYWNWWFGPGNEGEDIVKTRMQVAKESFAAIVTDMTNKRVGLMEMQYFEGGRVVYPIVDIDEGTNKQELINHMNELIPLGSTPAGEMTWEAARYFRGETLKFGEKSDTVAYSKAGHPDAFENDKVTYKSPLISACQKNHIILMTDGQTQSDINHVNDMETYMQTRGHVYTDDYECGPEQSTAYSNGKSCVDKMAWFLNREDLSKKPGTNADLFPGQQNVSVHTVAFALEDQDARDLLERTATLGGGKAYTAFSARALTEVFQKIVEKVNDTPSSGAAPTIPISAASRFSNGDKVYVALFKPGNTRGWEGNLKSYLLEEKGITYTVADETRTKTLVALVDTNSAEVTDPITQMTKEGALSRWTNSTDADGSNVLVGGMRDNIPGSVPLHINLGGSDTIVDSQADYALISKSLMNVATNAQKNEILDWLLSYPNSSKAGDGRARFIADPLHNSPKALAYTVNSGRKEVLFMATNVGLLHGIDTETGIEQVRWMPDDLLANAKVYFEDEPIDNDKIYGLDGSLAILHDDSNNDRKVSANEDAILYIGMRRGGRNLYALDVHDYARPRLLWKIQGGSDGFEDLGDTWSSILVRKMRYKGEIKDVLVFSGGYDSNHDAQLPGQYDGQDSLGRGLYIVDAHTGAKLYSAGFDDASFNHTAKADFLRASTPAAPAAIDITGNGLIDVIYTIDLAGNLVRYDILSDYTINNPESLVQDFMLEPKLLAQLSDFSVGDIEYSKNKREFFSAPAVVATENKSGKSISIAFGTGRRSAPRNLNMQNRFYVIRDTSVLTEQETHTVVKNSDLAQVSFGTLGSELNTTTVASGTVTALEKVGFYVNLGDVGSTKKGEKVLGKASVVQGIAAFSAYLPDNEDSTVCATLGLGTNTLYALDIETGETVQTFSIQQLGIFGDVNVLQFRGRVHLNVPVLDAEGNITTMLATGSGVDSSGNVTCEPGVVCTNKKPESFYKFWIERAL